MTGTKLKTAPHLKENEIADFLGDSLTTQDRERIESHLASCDECLLETVSSYESVEFFRKDGRNKKERTNIMKKINIYLILAMISFALSFALPRYFIQLLVATLLCGIKWIVDSKTTKMLITIYDAWKKDGDIGASRILESFDRKTNARP